MWSEKKSIFRSKTLLVNMIALAALLLQEHFGFVISPEEQAAIVIIANLVLRIITTQALELKLPKRR